MRWRENPKMEHGSGHDYAAEQGIKEGIAASCWSEGNPTRHP